MIILILILVIAGLITALVMQAKMKVEPVHVDIDAPVVDPMREARDNYINQLVNRYLKRKFPNMASYSLCYGKLGATPTDKLGFKVFMSDGTSEYIEEYYNNIFHGLAESDIDEFKTELSESTLKELLTKALGLVDSAKRENTANAILEIEDLDEDDVEKLRELLLDEGLNTIIKNGKLTIVIPIDEEI